jgi:uncharacterized membrane protein
MVDPNTLGPVEVAVILFEGNDFNGAVAPALADLQRSGVVQIIDLAFVMKDGEGNAIVVELEDSDAGAAFDEVNEHPLDLLNDEDLSGIADGLEPNSSALVVVWEDAWAADFARAVRDSNGEVIVLERIPRHAVLAALSALEEA